MPSTSRRVAAVLAATVATLGTTTTVAAEPPPGGPLVPSWHRPLPEATTITGWSATATRPATERWTDLVAVAPARGREVSLQQEADGSWVTRETLTLARTEVDVAEVGLTRHRTHAPVTRWRLAVAGSETAVPAVSATKVVKTTWEPGTRPQDTTVLVNKRNPVTPAAWEPDRLVRPAMDTVGSRVRLRPVAADALTALAEDAREATGQRLVLVSGYRSARYQERLYERYVRQHGEAAADRFSARGRHSEHQTGLAADVTQAGVPFTRFGGTPSSEWVAAHAWRHGFVVRYTEGTEDVTGYSPEPWHLRYVGPDLAAYVHHSGLTLEEALGAEAAPDYLG
ncbi:M15 family metallopeptidase [Isoptericola halotolerans]|uniref:M15 family metallopeptidase n=1 Tax=Isoptericola halotolerans TaxID=300560 RepID=UPI00388DF05E